jgi:hypothetical protein
MCKFFSFLSDGKGTYIYADAKTRKNNPNKEHDSHSWLAKHFLGKGSSKLEDLYNKYEFNPITKQFVVDNRGQQAEDDSVSAEKWVNELDFTRIVPELNPKPIFNPLTGKPKKSTKKDIENLKKWASVWNSVWDSVRDSVWNSVGDSVRDSVWDSVWNSVRDSVWASVWNSVRDSVRDSVWTSVWASVGAYIASFFNIQYKFDIKPLNDLWNRGFVPSFDGTTWRLHSGKNAKIVYEMKA